MMCRDHSCSDVEAGEVWPGLGWEICFVCCFSEVNVRSRNDSFPYNLMIF